MPEFTGASDQKRGLGALMYLFQHSVRQIYNIFNDIVVSPTTLSSSFIVRMYWTGLENINLATWQEKKKRFFLTKKGVILICGGTGDHSCTCTYYTIAMRPKSSQKITLEVNAVVIPFKISPQLKHLKRYRMRFLSVRKLKGGSEYLEMMAPS